MSAAAATWPRLQAAFAQALLDPACPVPDGLVGPDGLPSARRFAVYRNNVTAGLVRALQESYPAVAALVGEAFFQAMAREHARACPPRWPAMFDYGADFPAFIASFAPAAGLPYLADVARLERAWVEAYHAAEATCLTRAQLAGLPMDQAECLPLPLHPSARVLRSPWPALTIWQMHTGEAPLAPVDLQAGGQDVLVVRPDALVEVYALPAGAAAFASALAAGAGLGQATALALEDAQGFDLPATLGGLVDAGALLAPPTPTSPC